MAPILVFCYKRLECLVETIEALKKNTFAQESELYIFSDAAKHDTDIDKINSVRDFIKTIDGFKTVNIYFSPLNKGLAKSIIEGVTQIVNQHGEVIVLEDDLITSVNFLAYMNEALTYYGNNKQVFSVSGYTLPIKFDKQYEYDIYFTQRGSSWGWATWIDRWKTVDWELTDYLTFSKSRKFKKQFNSAGSDLSKMLKNQMDGAISSWAIRWVYAQFKQNCFSVYPTVSKIKNIGFGEGATHTIQKFNRFATSLDTTGKTEFKFLDSISLNIKINKQFKHFYSIQVRIKYKLLNTIASFFKISK